MVREDNLAAKMEAIDESLSILQQLANLTIERGVEEEGSGIPRQMKKIREDQVQNNAGGYVFQVDDLARVRRFLILGTDGGTYYVDEKKLTIENTAALVECIRAGKGGMVLREIVDISLEGRAPKQNALLLGLALCARYNVKDRKNLLSKSNEDGEKKAKKAAKKKKMQQEEKEEKMEEDKPKEEEKEEKEEEKCDDPKFEQYMMELQRTAMKAVSKVCRIPTHLFQFIGYCELVANSTSTKNLQGGGWGRAMRKCVAEWYLQKSPKELAMHLTKYPSREGWSHRDLLRLAHPMASQNGGNGKRKKGEMDGDLTLVYDQMFHYACTGEFDEAKSSLPKADNPDSSTPAADSIPMVKKSRCDYSLNSSMIQSAESSEALEFIRRVKEASKLEENEEGRCAELIREFGLVREHVPTKLLNSKKVWIALLEKMPMTALLRNLSKLGTLRLLDETEENKPHIDSVCAKFANEEQIHRARIHPISVVLAASIYKQGHGVKGKLSWVPNIRVKEALDKMFLLAFKNVQPTGKKYCLALDVSGSMNSPINGGVLTCREASAAMANIFLQTEENVECVAFESTLTTLPFTKETIFTEMVDYTNRLPFGSTDCSLPMVWAKEQQKKFDCFIVFTDNETWSGHIQPFEALRQYRLKMGIPDAKLAVMGMAATDFTIADPNDPGMMDFVGMDAAIPELLRSFVLNEL